MEELSCVLVNGEDYKDCIGVTESDIRKLDRYLCYNASGNIRYVNPKVIRFLKEFPNIKYVMCDDYNHPIKKLIIKDRSIDLEMISDILINGRLVDKETVFINPLFVDKMISRDPHIVKDSIKHFNDEHVEVLRNYPTLVNHYYGFGEVKYKLGDTYIPKHIAETMIVMPSDSELGHAFITGSFEFKNGVFIIKYTPKDIVDALECFYTLDLPDELKKGETDGDE